MTSLNRMLRFSLILTTAILFWSAPLVYGQSADAKSKGTASISGRVTIGDKAAPGIIVTAGFDPQNALGQTMSDEDGRYQISGLSAGQFVLAPVAPVYVLHGSNPTFWAGRVVQLSSGEAVDGIDFKLTRGGVITGRVIDADGRPVIEERISLLPVDEKGAPSRQPFPRMTNYQIYLTDDRGVYRIYGLPAGRYKVSVGNEPGMNAGLRASGYYQKTYHPDVTDSSKATIVDLSEAGETKGIDIKLGRRAATYTVSGRIVDTDVGKPLPGVPFAYGVIQKNQNQSYIAGTFSTGTPTNSLGEFRLEGVEPGRYAVFIVTNSFNPGMGAFADSNVYSDPLVFEVVDTDVTNLEIKAQQGLTLAGVVLSDGITDRKVLAKLPSLRIGASVAPTAGSLRVMPESRASGVGLDGSFQLAGLRPGRVSLYLAGAPGTDYRGFSITRIEQNGVLQNQGVEIRPGENPSGIKVFLAYGTGVIRGRVKVEGDTLPSDALIFVSVSRDGVPSRSSAQADSRGQFVIENLVAGTYEVMLQMASFGTTPLPRGFPRQHRQTVTVADGTEAEVVFTLDLNRKEGP